MLAGRGLARTHHLAPVVDATGERQLRSQVSDGPVLPDDGALTRLTPGLPWDLS
jgi:hypothetical protein